MARVLVVDDEQSIRITVSEFIKEDGHEVNTAADATQALRLIEEQDFDVIVTDIILPKIRGVELLKNIHEVSQEIQVVMITGEPNVDTAAQAVRAGAFDYLAKPISRKAIKEVVLKAAKTKALLDDKKRLEQENLMYQEHLEELVKERTAALQESEEYFRALIENSSDVIQIVDSEGIIRYVSPSVQQVMGYKPEELIGRPSVEVVHPDDLSIVTKAFEDAFQKPEAPVITECRCKHKDGTWRVIRGIGVNRLDVPSIKGFISNMHDITKRKKAEEELRQSFERLQKTLEGTVHALASVVELRDPYTAGHQRRVTALACAIAKELGLPQEQTKGLRMAGLIHDIGKISVPAEILSKPGPLTDVEFGLIQAHPQSAYNVLKEINFPWPVAKIVLEHHEWLDGSGYPQGLKGEEILLEARIIAVADIVEAMSSHRPYRPALGIDKALEEIEKNKGTLYDLKVVDACLKLFAEDRFTFES